MSAPLGPCAKVTVECWIVSADSLMTFYGTNSVRNPQQWCPRVGARYQRNDYALCRDVCRQPGHAEIMALRLAGEWARGGTAYVSHHRVCPDCERALRAAGVARICTGVRL